MNQDLETPKISLCCITAGPLHRVAAIFSLYRPVVDEIVCAVNGRFSPAELSCLDGIADRVIPCEMGADFLQERYRAWLYGQCGGDWIVTVDSDEVPSTALLEAMPNLARARDVVTYITTVRWCYPDLGHWLDEYPWDPSWKLVMVRNDPATLYIKGGVHEGVQPSAPYRYVDLPIYHLDCVTNSLASRQDKVGFYDSLDGIQRSEDGQAVSGVYYLPELHAKYPLGLAPPEDLQKLDAVLAAESPDDRVLDRTAAESNAPELPGTVPYAAIQHEWPEHPFDHSAYRATISIDRRARTPHRDLGSFATSEVRPILVEVQNSGDETWLREMRNNVALASKWYRSGSVGAEEPPLQEGARSAFTASVHPGDTFLHPLDVQAPGSPGTYRLVVDLVHEHVRWFDCGAEHIVEVTSR